MSDEKIAELSFEQAMEELEKVVSQLENGQVPLDQSISLYERGELLRKHCDARLKDAELRVQKIIAGAKDGAKGVEPFDPE